MVNLKAFLGGQIKVNWGAPQRRLDQGGSPGALLFL